VPRREWNPTFGARIRPHNGSLSPEQATSRPGRIPVFGPAVGVRGYPGHTGLFPVLSGPKTTWVIPAARDHPGPTHGMGKWGQIQADSGIIPARDIRRRTRERCCTTAPPDARTVSRRRHRERPERSSNHRELRAERPRPIGLPLHLILKAESIERASIPFPVQSYVRTGGSVDGGS